MRRALIVAFVVAALTVIYKCGQRGKVIPLYINDRNGGVKTYFTCSGSRSRICLTESECKEYCERRQF